MFLNWFDPVNILLIIFNNILLNTQENVIIIE